MFNRSVVAIALVVMWSLVVTSAAAQNSPDHRHVAFGKPHLGKRGNTIVLVQTITSTSDKEQRWVMVDMTGSDDTAPCDWLKRVGARQSYRFECPLKNPTGTTYTTRVRVFKDAQLDDREIHWIPELVASAPVVAAAVDAASEPPTVPRGTFEHTAATLPATFKPTWYRRVDKGFGMRAYENSGDLTVSADDLLFVDGDKTVRIPYTRIQSVRWEPLPNDIANHWVVVRFTSEDGKQDGVAFRDGARLGNRGRTGPIYQAVRQPTKPHSKRD
jgi:hypothetical protein